ncbi:MAG TPA: hypothetical protein VKG43_02125 [Acidimicrobiales bacterium]|nr:hypothetical protein [Acidimicrobiales bacterium]
MFGHEWVKAEGTVAAIHHKPGMGGQGVVREFAVDVRPLAGRPVRALVEEPNIEIDFRPPDVGDVVGVEVDERGRVRFDKVDPRLSIRAHDQAGADRFAATLHLAPGTPAAGRAAAANPHDTEGLADLFAQTPGAQVIRLDPNDAEAHQILGTVEKLAPQSAPPAGEGPAGPPG